MVRFFGCIFALQHKERCDGKAGFSSSRWYNIRVLPGGEMASRLALNEVFKVRILAWQHFGKAMLFSHFKLQNAHPMLIQSMKR
jgi:hypothetical protein